MSNSFININGSFEFEANEYLLQKLVTDPDYAALGFTVFQTPHTTIAPLIYLQRDSKILKAYQSDYQGGSAPTLRQKKIVLEEFKGERSWDKHAYEGTIAYADANIQDDNIFSGSKLSDALINQFNSGIENDLTRYVWFGDTEKVTVVSGVPQAGVPDTNYNVINGLWTCLMEDSSTSPSSLDEILRIEVSNGTVAQVSTSTLTSTTAGTIIVTINGVAYSELFDTDVNTTIANWLASHKATIETANTFNGVSNLTVTAATNVITVTSEVAGLAFSLVGTDGGTGGSFADVDTVANVRALPLADEEAENIMIQMYEDAPGQLRERIRNNEGVVYMVTRSIYDNYLRGLQNRNATEAAFRTLEDGKRALTINGIPVMPFYQWSVDLNDFATPYPHRAVLTYPRNLQVAVRDTRTFANLDFWVDKNANELRSRAQLYLGTGYALPEDIVIAY